MKNTYQVFRLGVNGWLLTTTNIERAKREATRQSEKHGVPAWIMDCDNGHCFFMVGN